jgi:hypothetical protein
VPETTMPFPWCLHKDHDEWWDVTRHMDQARMYLAPCGGVRCEPYD